MKPYPFLFSLLLFAMSCMPVAAHEFWLLPQSFTPDAGSVTQLTLHVGENFEGQLIGWTKDTVMSVRTHHAGKSEGLHARLSSATPLATIETSFAPAGTHVVAVDSYPSKVTLPAEKFHAYLLDEGLDAIIRQRAAHGTAATPGRERYRRHVKTLLRVGGKTDNSYRIPTQQRLEIVPLGELFSQPLNVAQRFVIHFDQKPLAHALVKAWHLHNGQLMLIKRRSERDGTLALAFPHSGTWMLSVVHMIAATDSTEVDWDSYWGNLTFALPRH